MGSQELNAGERSSKPQACCNLSSRLFYGIILMGLWLGLFASCSGGWVYLQGDRKPSGRGIWEESAGQFVIPICAIVGATFGGLAGVAAAVGLAVYRRGNTRLDEKSAGR